MRLYLACATALIMLITLWLAPSDSEPPEGDHQRQWVKIVFGLDQKDAQWGGQIQIDKGEITSLQPWCFETRDKLNGKSHSWTIRTAIPDQRRVTYAEPTRGILVEVASKSGTTLTVKTKQGEFPIRMDHLKPGHPSKYLNGRASAELLGTAALVANTTTDDDYAAIAVDKQGQRHVAWIAYDDERKRNHLLIRNVDDPKSKPQHITKGKEFASLKLLSFPSGAVQALWCAPDEKGNWDIYSAMNHGRGWQQERVTTAVGTDCHLRATMSKDGALWITWQSFRKGNADIYFQRYHRGRWLESDIAVTNSIANDWQPSISVDAQGRAWIAYDSYENGNYDIFLRSVFMNERQAKLGARIAISQSRDFEACASVLADGDGRIWVAYHAAGPRWGKDFRNVSTFEGGNYSEPLHASRRLELRCVIDGKVHQPRAPLPQILPPNPIKKIVREGSAKPSRFYEYPQLALDGQSGMWLFFRMNRQGYAPHPPNGIDWKIYATTFTKHGWLDPIELPHSQGRQNQRVAITTNQDGALCCAWADGNRFASVNRKYAVYHGQLPTIKASTAGIPLKEVEPQQKGKPDNVPSPPWTISHNDNDYHLYYGDLHRHTNISRCSPTIDGDLVEAHRYALDAVQYDFLAVTDHTRDVDSFSWWRTQQAADLFHVPGRYVPIYAYERSNNTVTGGHRNVFFLERGWDINPSDHWYVGRGLKVKETRPDTTLYPWMKKRGVSLTAAHTPVYAKKAMKGTWTYHDPQVEPIAEIYQSFRRSYERADQGVPAEASLVHALNKGHKLGFIASSDHIATHTAYACVWAKEKTRKAIFEALQARRTFGATDRIALEFRIGKALMGEEIEHRERTVSLSIHAKGTSTIREVEIIRNGEVLTKISPNKQSINLEYVDENPLPNASYYYVRLIQRDGGRAWGSPIWLNR